MRGAHSYEEPAYDVYPLRPVPQRAGRDGWAACPDALPLRKLARIGESRALNAGRVQTVGDPARTVGAGGMRVRSRRRVPERRRRGPGRMYS